MIRSHSEQPKNQNQNVRPTLQRSNSSNLDNLTTRTGRIVINLESPRKLNINLPNLDELTQNEKQEAYYDEKGKEEKAGGQNIELESTPSIQTEKDANGSATTSNSTGSSFCPLSSSPSSTSNVSNATILLDFVARISHYEPRITRYALSRFSSAPKSSEPASYGFGFSLIDIQRRVLGRGWKGKEKATFDDGDGLDVDLSEIFDNLGGRNQDELVEGQEIVGGAGNDRDPNLQIPASVGPGLFLNYYSSNDLVALLESTGVLAALAKKGYTSPSLVFDTSDPYQHRLSLVDGSLFTAPDLRSGGRFLIDLYMKRRREWSLDGIVCYQLMSRLIKAGSWQSLRELSGEIRAPFIGIEGAKEVVAFFELELPKAAKLSKKRNGCLDLTEIAWLEMINPLKKVDEGQDLLPGQRFPGLGLSRQVMSVFETMVSSSKVTDGLLNFPFHFHQSVSYSTRGYHHIDPIFEAYVRWMFNSLSDYVAEHSFCFVAYCVTMGFTRRITEVESEDGWKQVSSRLERWSPSEQVFPASAAMLSLLDSPEYSRLYNKYYEIFELDGGANLTGVDSVVVEGKKRSRLILAVEDCPELWKYSNVLKDRVIEEYED